MLEFQFQLLYFTKAVGLQYFAIPCSVCCENNTELWSLTILYCRMPNISRRCLQHPSQFHTAASFTIPWWPEWMKSSYVSIRIHYAVGSGYTRTQLDTTPLSGKRWQRLTLWDRLARTSTAWKNEIYNSENVSSLITDSCLRPSILVGIQLPKKNKIHRSHQLESLALNLRLTWYQT